MTATVTTTAIETVADTPYNKEFVANAKTIGGKWDGARKVWTFDPRDEARVRELCRNLFGTDGSEPEGDLVTVRVKLADHEGDKWDSPARFAGRVIAERPARDVPVRFAAGVVLVEGKLPRTGGSMRYPMIEAGRDAVVEIRDLPRAALSTEREDSYEIVSPEPAGDAAPDVEALLAEREALLARIAEIDAVLPEPEGVEATTREAAAALGVSVRTVQRWASTGKVEARKDDAGRWVVTVTVGR